MYQDLGISSNVWIKSWIHSSLGHDAHSIWNSVKWLQGLFYPSYLLVWYTSISTKHAVINHRHYSHSWRVSLWTAHQRTGVAFNASPNANKHWGSYTFTSNSSRNPNSSGSSLYIYNSMISVTAWRNNYAINPHFMSDTSRIWFCQFYTCYSCNLFS